MKRRICIFCETWESGGIESFLHNALLHMDRSGLEIDLVVAELRESVFTQGLRDAGICFTELSGKTFRLRENYRRFGRLLAERRYDVLHLNIYQGMSLYYAELAARTGVPIRIAHSHNTALRKSLTRPGKRLLHELYRDCYTADATALWASSKAAADFMFSKRELERCGYTFIPNGIDVERFRFRPEVRERVRKELGLDGKFVIGNVGRMCRQKNQTFLLDVLAEVLKIRPESVLLLAGAGEDQAALEEKARRLHIECNVIFYGVSNRVEELFWAMDAFAFPSLFEGLGIVAVEAQCAGLPVVCSEHVPEEARVSPALQSHSLTEGTKGWSRALLAAGRPDAEAAARAVRETGFDIADAAKMLERYYLE